MTRPWCRLLAIAVLAVSMSVAGGWGGGLCAQTPPSSDAAATLPDIRTHDNRTPAGRLQNGALTLRLAATTGLWRPEGDAGPVHTVQAFAEEGQAPQIPGPLVRIPEGSEIRVTVRNSISGSTLRLYGMMTRPGDPEKFVEIAPGAVRELRFQAGAPGTYYYWATTTGVALNERFGIDSQLTGAFIVDPARARGDSEDRVFVISEWIQNQNFIASRAAALAINGRSWPHTERLTLPFGLAADWRVINGSSGNHPMHLHGTFYTVESRGNAGRDEIYGPEGRRLVTTELLEPGATMMMRWVPDRVGNWLFHCHVLAHVTGLLRHLDKPPAERAALMAHVEHDPEQAMAGLVIGIKVLPGDETAAPDLEPHVARRLKLFLQSTPTRYGPNPGFGFALVEGTGAEPAPEPEQPASPTLVLTRGEPVAISLINQLQDETSIHWHGLELESYNDGVPGWSGHSGQIAPAVRPGETFDVRFTPPRAGTFIYHTHAHDNRQLRSGLYGALVVLEPGQKFDSDLERVVLIGGPAPGSLAVEVNRSTNPQPMVLRVGVKHRFRLINITPNASRIEVSLRGEGPPLQWRAIAKDGADLPPSQATLRVARQVVAVGETYDFEYQPTTPGELRLEALTFLRRGPGPFTPGSVTSLVVQVTR